MAQRKVFPMVQRKVNNTVVQFCNFNWYTVTW